MTTPPITLAGNLPGDEDYNGIEDIRDDLVKDPARQRLAVISFDVIKTTTKTDTGETTPIVRVRRVEVPEDAADVKAVQGLMDRLYEGRSGALPLTAVADPDPDDEGEEEANGG